MGAQKQRNSDRRAHARYRLHDVACDLGSVIDLSQSGIRIISDQLRRGVITLTLTASGGKPLVLRATVEWHRALGPCEYVMGLRFCKPYPEVAKLIAKARRLDPSVAAPEESHHSGAKALKYLGLCLLLTLVPGLLAMLFMNTLALNNQPVVDDVWSKWEMPALFTAGGLVLAACLMMFIVVRRALRKRRTRQDFMALRRSTVVLNTILDSSLGGVMVLQPIRPSPTVITDFEIKLINRSAEDFLNRRAGDVLGQYISKALPGLLDDRLKKRLVETMQYGYPVREKQPIQFEGRWFEFAAVLIGNAVAVTFVDRSEEQRHLDLLHRSAYYDVLTKLPNRKLLVEQVQREIDKFKRHADRGFALLFIDMDGFKLINDGYGHDVGDAYLIEIANRLNANLRSEDLAGRSRNNNESGAAHPARLGGDEFVVLLEEVKDSDAAVAVGERLLQSLSEDITIGEHRFAATASIGVLLVTSEYQTVDAILRDADAAMYSAKTTGKGRCVLFDRDMREEVFKHVAVEKDVRQAIEDQSFELRYRPVLSVDQQEVVGIDVAPTWPSGSPNESGDVGFVESLDAMSHPEALEQRYWSQVAQQLKAWQEGHPSRSAILIDLSMSQKQLLHPKLTVYLNELIGVLNRGPSGVRINIRETAVMRDLDTIVGVAERLNEAGYPVALDDFGCGMVPLACLHRLPAKTIKLHRRFIRSAFEGAGASRSVANAVIQLAADLGLELVAKGVNDSDVLEFISGLGCTRIQGKVAHEWCDADQTGASTDLPGSTHAA